MLKEQVKQERELAVFAMERYKELAYGNARTNQKDVFLEQTRDAIRVAGRLTDRGSVRNRSRTREARADRAVNGSRRAHQVPYQMSIPFPEMDSMESRLFVDRRFQGGDTWRSG